MSRMLCRSVALTLALGAVVPASLALGEAEIHRVHPCGGADLDGIVGMSSISPNAGPLPL